MYTVIYILEDGTLKVYFTYHHCNSCKEAAEDFRCSGIEYDCIVSVNSMEHY